MIGNDWYIDFTSNGNNYNLLTQVLDEDDDECKLKYDGNVIYNATTNIWANNNYKIISFIRGIGDVALISFVEQNATQVIDPPSGGNIEFGTFSISDTHWGTRDIDKMIYNDIVIYEKS